LLLLVRPRVLGEKLGSLDLTKPRLYPYQFSVPTFETDSFEFALPDGYRVDELPDAARAAFAFGEYTSKIENEGATLKYRREYKIQTSSVPPENIRESTRMREVLRF